MSGDTAIVNEAESIAVYGGTVDGGTFTLQFNLAGGVTFTTAGIAHNANAAIVQTAIDTASPVGIGDGHIVVAGGPLTTTPMTFTFSGASVAGANHGAIVVDGTSLTGGGSAGAVSQTTAGQAGRAAWEALQMAGIIGGTIGAADATTLGVAALAVDTDTNAQAAVTAITAAVATLGQSQATVGTIENRLQFAMTLAQSQIVSNKAAESRIRDANIAEESANLTRYSILTQSGIAALAQANAQSGVVLRLLQ